MVGDIGRMLEIPSERVEKLERAVSELQQVIAQMNFRDKQMTDVLQAHRNMLESMGSMVLRHEQMFNNVRKRSKKDLIIEGDLDGEQGLETVSDPGTGDGTPDEGGDPVGGGGDDSSNPEPIDSGEGQDSEPDPGPTEVSGS